MRVHRLNDLGAVLGCGVSVLPVGVWAALCGVHRNAIYYHIREGHLPVSLVLGANYVRWCDLVVAMPELGVRPGC